MKKVVLLFLLFQVTFVFSQVGTTCQSPIVIGALPYTTTDDTANYADNYDPPTTSPQPTCSTTTNGNNYHGGNDVVYSYTATVTGTIKVEIPNAIGWTGMFIYANCTDIGVQYAACSTGTSAGVRLIDNFPVTAGQTYYILISSWPTPQTVPYTLNVTSTTLSVSEQDLIAGRESSVYPNPTNKELQFKSSKDIVSANIYTMEGKKVQAFKVSDNRISVENLSVGSYIIEYTDKSGKTTTKVFVKK